MKHFTAKKSCHFSTVEIETKFEQAYVYLILLEEKYSFKISLRKWNVYTAQMLGFMFIGQIKIRTWVWQSSSSYTDL